MKGTNTVTGNLSDLPSNLIKLNINGFPVYYKREEERSKFYLFTSNESVGSIIYCNNHIDFISQCKIVLHDILEMTKQPLSITEALDEVKGYDNGKE